MSIRKKNLSNYKLRSYLKKEFLVLFFFIEIFLFILSVNSCSDFDGIKNKKESKEKTDILFLFLAQNRLKGNCFRKDSSANINYCDRRSSGICNSNDLILTSSERNFNLSEGNNLVKAVPSCSFSFINTGIVSEQVTSLSEEDSIKANNSYTVVESCEATGIASTALLIIESELLFINSSKGRIGIFADKTYNTPDSVLLLSLGTLALVKQSKADALTCLDTGFSQAEKDLFSDLRIAKKTKSLTCSTKNGSVNPCP